MLTKNINFINFPQKKNSNVRKLFNNIIKNYLEGNDKLLLSLSDKYKYSFNLKNISQLKKFNNYKIIGMGGSVLGAEAIYSFLKKKIKKKFTFLNNLKEENKIKDKNKTLNIIISKSGNTLETITNMNSNHIKSNLLFITENKKNYLREIAEKFKSEIIEHKNYIGGRYSVLSEVGMLPAELMGLHEKKFKQLNNLIKNKVFVNNLIKNVESTLSYVKLGMSNSVILNYDEDSQSLFYWYQQLIAESLGKKSKGILPIISSMPKDNHSVMQLYLDGAKNNFFTFFDVLRKNTKKIENKDLLNSHYYLQNMNIQKIILAQKIATQNVFKKKRIPFRSFTILKKDEKTLGELFCFFILETILLGRALKVNPYDQPSVELIKAETKKILIRA
jgi:glucose-6-phosphate isomerase